MNDKCKICLLGAAGVGKTSLVKRFVHRTFSDVYSTTIGVTIEKKRARVGGRETDLVIWDLSGEDEFESVRLSYTRGASGLLVVMDGTRRATIDVAIGLLSAARAIAGDVPCVFVLNKADLTGMWDVDATAEASLQRAGAATFETSAKTGAGVEEAFCALASAMRRSPDELGRDT